MLVLAVAATVRSWLRVGLRLPRRVGERRVDVRVPAMSDLREDDTSIVDSAAVDTIASRRATVSAELDRARVPLIMTSKEVGKLLRITRRQLFNIRKDGQLHATRVGREIRFYRWDVVCYLVAGEE